MRNRAKCKLCLDILESFHQHDYVTCKCGEIAVDGGQSYLRASAKNWENFLRVDDNDKEIEITIKSLSENEPANETAKGHENSDRGDYVSHTSTKKDLLDMLKEMISNIEKLPDYAMSTPINHYDFSSLLILLLAFFKDDCSADN